MSTPLTQTVLTRVAIGVKIALWHVAQGVRTPRGDAVHRYQGCALAAKIPVNGPRSSVQ